MNFCGAACFSCSRHHKSKLKTTKMPNNKKNAHLICFETNVLDTKNASTVIPKSRRRTADSSSFIFQWIKRCRIYLSMCERTSVSWLTRARCLWGFPSRTPFRRLRYESRFPRDAVSPVSVKENRSSGFRTGAATQRDIISCTRFVVFNLCCYRARDRDVPVAVGTPIRHFRSQTKSIAATDFCYVLLTPFIIYMI